MSQYEKPPSQSRTIDEGHYDVLTEGGEVTLETSLTDVFGRNLKEDDEFDVSSKGNQPIRVKVTKNNNDPDNPTVSVVKI